MLLSTDVARKDRIIIPSMAFYIGIVARGLSSRTIVALADWGGSGLELCLICSVFCGDKALLGAMACFPPTPILIYYGCYRFFFPMEEGFYVRGEETFFV